LPINHNAKAPGRWRIALFLLLLVAATEFFIRGPLRLRHGTEWNDFLSPYIQSRAWMRGMDPYSDTNFLRLWPADKPMFTFIARDAADGTLVAKRGVPSPYPITTFAVVAPIGLFPWKIAEFLWIALNLSAVGLVICGTIALTGARWRDQKTWVFAAFVLALAPIHSGLATENPAIFVMGLCVAAVWAATNSRDNLGGVLLALASCLKPQLGLCFVLFFVVQKKWRIVWSASVCAALIVLIAITRMQLAGTPWLVSYLQASREVFASGAINDFTSANPVWFHMVNLQPALYPLFRTAAAANLAALLLGVALLGIWSWLAWTSTRYPPQLLLSALLVNSLVPLYHRSYDAALLVFPLAWILLHKHRRALRALANLLVTALFLIPGGVLVSNVGERVHLPASVMNAGWWRSLVVAHQAWALLALAVLLLLDLWEVRNPPYSEAVISLVDAPMPKQPHFSQCPASVGRER
jgi:hypothetical protein